MCVCVVVVVVVGLVSFNDDGVLYFGGEDAWPPCRVISSLPSRFATSTTCSAT